MFSRWLHLRLVSRVASHVRVQKLSNSSNSALIPLARDLLKGLGEGQVSMVKDEETGVATITLNHPQRKNALSGKFAPRSLLIFGQICLIISRLFFNTLPGLI